MQTISRPFNLEAASTPHLMDSKTHFFHVVTSLKSSSESHIVVTLFNGTLNNDVTFRQSHLRVTEVRQC